MMDIKTVSFFIIFDNLLNIQLQLLLLQGSTKINLGGVLGIEIRFLNIQVATISVIFT